MSINLDRFARSLLEADAEPAFTPPQVNGYVLRRIYEPLLRDEPVRFSELDFSAFDDDDLAAFEELLDEYMSVEQRLSRLSECFRRAEPVSASARTFC